MKIGEWWCVFDERGRAMSVEKRRDDAWCEAFWNGADPFGSYSWRGWSVEMKKRGWTCERVIIERPK